MTTTYGSADQAITITLTSLAAGAARESTALTNTSHTDILVFGQVAITGTVDGSRGVSVYAYGATGGSTFPTPITGVDASIVFDPIDFPAAVPLGSIKTPETGTYRGGPWSLRAAFGESPPSQWGLIVANRHTATGVFSATPSDHTFTYQGVTEVFS